MQLTIKSDGEIINVAISLKSKLVNSVEPSKYRNYKKKVPKQDNSGCQFTILLVENYSLCHNIKQNRWFSEQQLFWPYPKLI